MFFEKDYIMRMIGDMTRFIALVGLGRTEAYVTMPYQNKSENGELPPERLLYADCIGLAEKGDIDKAEDALYERTDFDDLAYLDVGLAFYNHLAALGDDFLESHDYSREEIAEGLRDMAERFGVDMSSFELPD